MRVASAPKAVTRVARSLMDMGCYEVSLGDTIGVGTPRAVKALIKQVAEYVPVDRLAVHFHDTFGQALSNILAALQLGVAVVDTVRGRAWADVPTRRARPAM